MRFHHRPVRTSLNRPPLIWTALLLAVAVGIGLPGCGSAHESTGSDGAGRLVRPQLRRLGDGQNDAEMRIAQHLVPPRDIEPWVVKTQDEPRAKRIAKGQFALRVDSWGKRRITVPGSFPSKEFNQVALSGIFPGAFSISLTLTGPGGIQLESARMATVNSQQLQTVLFDLPRLRRVDAVFDHVSFQVAKGSKWFEIHGVDFLDRPLSMALPDPEGEGQLIILDHARHGVGVASGTPLVCNIDAEPGAALRFAFGLPRELRLEGQKLELSVTLTGQRGDGASGKPARESWKYDVESSDDDAPAWKQVQIPLDSFSGPTELRVELAVNQGEALCALAELSVLHRGASNPSVLLVTSDTHRADHLGSVDSTLKIETPALDALAARGVLFEDCYSSTNVTSPSHVALMTATHPRDTHLVTNTAHLSEQALTLAERYREAGYMTLGVVSVRHLGPAGTGLGQGFDRMIAPSDSTWDADVAIDQVRNWLEDAQGVPVFVWMHLFDAHHPYIPPKRYDRYYYPKDKDPFDKSVPALEFGPECIPDDLRELRDLEFPKAQYRAEITFLDNELQRLFDHPQIKDGIVAVTADHGEILEKDGTYFNHSALYPDTLHIPMILTWPGAPAGLRLQRGVEQIDLGRTLLDLSGLEDVPFPGRNMVADLDPAHEPTRMPRFALSANATSASVTLKPWHFVLYLRQYRGRFREERPKHSFELYNLDSDPECLKDLVSKEPKRVAQLHAMLVEWLSTSSETSLLTAGQQTAEAMAELAALGYATAAPVADSTAWIDIECDCELCAQF